MIKNIDHVVLTVSDIEKSIKFYKEVLMMEHKVFGNNRHALHFGNQKINLQELGQEKRNCAKIGSGDICLITNWSTEQILLHLEKNNVKIIEGPILKSGAIGNIRSIYFLDPDKNLVEISEYI